MNERKPQPVFVDFAKVDRDREVVQGAPLTPQQKEVLSEADAIVTDATACGRSVAETVGNIEKYGGKVSDAVKAVLGLIPSVN